MSLQLYEFFIQVGRKAFFPFHAEYIAVDDKERNTIWWNSIKPEHLIPGAILHIGTIAQITMVKIRELCLTAIKENLPVSIIYYKQDKAIQAIAVNIKISHVRGIKNIDTMEGSYRMTITIAGDKSKFLAALNTAKELSKEHDKKIYQETVEALADLMAPGLLAHPNMVDKIKNWPTYIKKREPFSFKGTK